MISRLIIAALGAVAVTIGLLLFMDDVTSRYLLRDTTQYFRITDYIPAPDRGRQLPNVPVVPESAPDRPELENPVEEELPTLEELPWELQEDATPNLEEQLMLEERQAALPRDPSRWVAARGLAPSNPETT